MSKLKKKASGSRRQASGKSGKAKPEVRSPKPEADIEDQLAALEEQIAALGARDEGLGARDFNTSPSPLTPSPSPRAQLPTPAIGLVLATSNAIVVTWEPVANSQQVLAVYSKDPDFENHGAVGVSGSMNSATITGLQPNTLYYIRIKATGTGSYTDSEFSSVKTITTQRDATSGTGDETATHIQGWLEEMKTAFENASTLVPQLENTVLTTPERRRLLGSGVRRYGFADKVSDVAEQFPLFWPASANMQDALKTRLREIEALRNTLVWLRYVTRVTGDLLLLAGDDAFRMANTYYATVRTAARRHLPEAQQVFQMIDLFWRRPRRTSEEPTIPEVERDVHGLLTGAKEGSVFIENESDTVVKGKKTVIDKTRRKPRNGFKEIETGEVDLSADSADVC